MTGAPNSNSKSDCSCLQVALGQFGVLEAADDDADAEHMNKALHRFISGDTAQGAPLGLGLQLRIAIASCCHPQILIPSTMTLSYSVLE